jgi:type IV pilus assembly protein PilM
MAKNLNAIGLDIGSNSIKLIQVKRSNQGVTLENFAMSELAPEAIYEGGIHDTDAVVSTIKELVDSLQLKSKTVAISIGGHSVIVKKITLPAMSDEELAESINWEADHYIPYDLVDVYLDYQILQTRADQGQMDVMLVAAKREVVDQYLEVVREAGLKPVAVDTDCFAVQNAFDVNYSLPDNQLICLIHIGAENLNINVIAYGVNTFTRDLQLGGDSYTREIQKQMGTSYQEAEAYKLGGGELGGNQIIPQDVQRILVMMSEQIASEINRSLEFHLATSGESRFEKIYLSGGAVRLSILADEVAKKTNTPVELLDPFHSVEIDSSVFNVRYLDDSKSFAPVAFGLGLRHKNDKGKDLIRINLLPVTEADRIEDGRNYFLILFMLVVIVSGAFFTIKSRTNEELETKERVHQSLNVKQRSLKEKQDRSKALEREFEALKNEVDRKKEVIDDLTQNQISPAGFLSELSYILSPPRDDTERENFTQKGWRWNWDTGALWISDIRESKREVRLKGYGRTIDDVGELLKRLQTSKYVVKAGLKMTENELKGFNNGRRAQFVRFEMLLRVIYGTSDLKRLFLDSNEPLPTETD